MKLIVVILSILLSAGCATPKASLSSLSFSKIESLRLGLITREQTRELIGSPSKTLVLPKYGPNEVWIYEHRINDEDHQVLSLVFRPDGRLISSTWSPLPDDYLATETHALAYFKNSTFEKSTDGWNSPDAYSEDIVYFDASTGVSLHVREATKKVMAIALESPQPRLPATNQ